MRAALYIRSQGCTVRSKHHKIRNHKISNHKISNHPERIFLISNHSLHVITDLVIADFVMKTKITLEVHIDLIFRR